MAYPREKMFEDFTYELKGQWHCININQVLYSMPYVMTLKLKRFTADKKTSSLQEQLEGWYASLTPNQRILVTKQGILN